MRPEIIRTYRSVHTWTGILAGMALFIAFYAGGLTLFKDAISRWAAPPTAQVASVPLSAAPELINRSLAAHPAAAKDFRLRLEPSGAGLGWKEGADDHDPASGRHYSASLESHGALTVRESSPPQLGAFIDVLHRVVGLPIDHDYARLFMGLVTILYVLALVSGLIIVLPTLAREFFAFRAGARPRRLWTDAHRVAGLASLPFHLVIALTAMVFAFHDDLYAIQNKLIHGGKLASAWTQGPPAKVPPAPRTPDAMLPPQELLTRVKALSPSFEPTSIQYRQVTSPKAMALIWGHDPRALSPRSVGGFLALDPYSGKVLNADYLPGRQDLPHTILSVCFAFHFGAFGGQPVRWIYFLLAMTGAWLFYSGNLLWLESRRKAQAQDGAAPRQRRSVRVMGALTVGVCLGCICGISLTAASAKWLSGHALDLGFWHRAIYYAAFFAAILCAFLQGAARASVTLLRAAALFTLAIPATSLLAWLLPSLGLWAHRASAGVDATALLAGLCFIWMARAAARRVRHGAPDSIWSASLRPGAQQS